MRSVVVLLVLGCGGASVQAGTSSGVTTGDPQRAVSLGEWCKALTQTMCIRAGSCIGSLEITTSCTESAMSSCVAGRAEDTPSGHKGSELDGCINVFQSTPCDGYMGSVASHAECHAQAPTSQ